MIVCHFDSNLSRLQLTIKTGVFWNKPLQGMAPPVHKLKVLSLTHPLMHSLSSLLFQALSQVLPFKLTFKLFFKMDPV